jgi:hypothetical protein
MCKCSFNIGLLQGGLLHIVRGTHVPACKALLEQQMDNSSVIFKQLLSPEKLQVIDESVTTLLRHIPAMSGKHIVEHATGLLRDNGLLDPCVSMPDALAKQFKSKAKKLLNNNTRDGEQLQAFLAVLDGSDNFTKE